MKILTHNFKISHKPGKTAYHSHAFWQIDYYYHTDIQVKIKINDKSDYLDDTRFAVMPPHYMHQFDVFSPCKICTIKFMPADNSDYNDLKGAVLDFGGYKNILDGIFNSSLVENKLDNKIREHYLEIFLLRFLKSKQYGGNIKEQIYDERLSESIYYMKRTTHNKLSLAKLASKANMSENHFIRCFKREFGITPMHYARKLLIRKAIEMLTYSELSLIEVGDQLGFPDQHCFCRAFHREVGMPPGAYRKLQREPR